MNDGSGVGDNGNSSVRTRYGRLEWMYIPDGARINEFRFGWFKDRHADNLNPNLIPATGLAQIVVEGQANLGASADLPRIDPSENRFQVADSLTLVSWKHTLRVGFDFLNTEDFVRYRRNQNGTYEYADFTSFAKDFSGNTTGSRNWATYSQRFGNPVFDETVRDYSLFTEDQFRVNSRLTLHYGLRYEYSALPQPKQANPEYPESGHIRSSATNLAPRFGAALAFNRSRSVVRGGYGIFYARYHTGLIATFFQENGIGQPSIELETRFLASPQSGPVFPGVLQAPTASSAVDLTIPSKDYRNAYTHQADLAIEHAISADWNVSASWLTSRALHLTTVRDLNVGPTSSTVTYEIDDLNGKAVGRYTTPAYRLVNRVNPKWRRVNSVEAGGNSYYNALVVQLRKRLSHGLEGFLAYTWSHAIDFNQGGGADNIFFSDGPRTLTNGDYRGGEGLFPTRSAAPPGGQLHVGAEVDREDGRCGSRAGNRMAAVADLHFRVHPAGHADHPGIGRAVSRRRVQFHGKRIWRIEPCAVLSGQQPADRSGDPHRCPFDEGDRDIGAPSVAREFRGLQCAESRCRYGGEHGGLRGEESGAAASA